MEISNSLGLPEYMELNDLLVRYMDRSGWEWWRSEVCMCVYVHIIYSYLIYYKSCDTEMDVSHTIS